MKLPYFKLGEALDEVKDGFSFGTKSEKLRSVSKLVGKTVANAGMLAVELGAEAVKRAPEVTGSMAKRNLDQNGHQMTSEQVEKCQDLVRRGNEAHERRMEEERERDERERHGD